MKNLKIYGLLILLIIGGGFIIKQGLRENQEDKLLLTEGKQVTGKVLRQETRKKRRGYNYYLHVEFQTEKGQSVQKRLKVSEDWHDRHGSGDPIRLIYAPSNPLLVTDKEQIKPSHTTTLAGAAMCLGGVGGLAWKLRRVFGKRNDSSDPTSPPQGDTTQTLQT